MTTDKTALRKWLSKEVLIGLGLGILGGWAGPTFMISVDDAPPRVLADKLGIHQLCWGPAKDSTASDRFFLTLPFDRPCRIKGEIEYKPGHFEALEAKGMTVTPVVEKFDFTDHVADVWLVHEDLDVWRPSGKGALPFRPTTFRSVTLEELETWGVQRVRLEVYRADRIKGAEDDVPEVIEWKAR